ncbi:MAG: tight adherence protein [Frankiaceae bacterium]|jgi:tight adherence protein C|nr:tight adherence protein [Frankiaceae bacterium]
MDPNVMLYGGIGAAFVGLTVVVAVLASPRKTTAVERSLSAISDMHLLGASDVDPSFGIRVLSPAWTRLAAVGRRLTPGGRTETLRAKLDAAGSPAGWTVDRVLAYKVLGMLALGTFGIVSFFALLHMATITAVFLTVALAVLGLMLPNFVLYQTTYNRNEKLQRQLPDSIDMLSVSVEAGLGFDAALAQVARNTTGPLAQEFFRVLQEMQIGLGRAEAMRALAERTNIQDVKTFVSAMVQAEQFGIPIAQVLRIQSKEMRLKRSQRAEEQAQKLPVKIIFPVVFCILPALFVIVIGPAAINIMNTFFTK